MPELAWISTGSVPSVSQSAWGAVSIPSLRQSWGTAGEEMVHCSLQGTGFQVSHDLISIPRVPCSGTSQLGALSPPPEYSKSRGLCLGVGVASGSSLSHPSLGHRAGLSALLLCCALQGSTLAPCSCQMTR